MRKSFYLCFFTIGIIASSLTPLNAQWEGWNWRRQVAINNTSGSTLSDFQVKIDLGNLTPAFNFAFAKSDGSDLRVTDSTGVPQLPFWIERWDTTAHQATIWVKVPSIPTAGARIYLYYGNPLATSLSNGTNTFNFFDDFSTYDVVSGQNWIRKLSYTSSVWGPGAELAHDWKYASEMLHGALEFQDRNRCCFNIESLETEIEQEFNYIHSQINQTTGTVTPDAVGFPAAEPQYCYGLILSNLAKGYQYFVGFNPTLGYRCYNDMVLVFDYLSATYPTVGAPFPSDAGGFGWLLVGFSNAHRQLNDQGDAARTSLASTIVQDYSATFITNQAIDGSWTGAVGIQEHLKRDFGLLYAHELFTPADTTYTYAVKKNIDYILNTFWISSNGGLEWYANPATSDRFFECHQIWFMIAVTRLNGRSGGVYNYTDKGLEAWYFLTDNNYAGIDMYVDNYDNHNAFFSYRDVQQDGTFQDVDLWKGSYEIGTALWGMAINYTWVSNYQSSHSSQPYNYLDMMVKQIKNSPTNRGFFSPGTLYPSSTLWNRVGNPNATIIQDNANNVLSSIGGASHNVYVATIDNSFDNFVFETKVKLSQDLNNQCTPEITFRYTNDNNKYFTMLRGEVPASPPLQNDLFIRKYYNGSQFINATAGYNYTANQYYKYKIVANGNTIGLYLDDALVLSPTNAGGDV